MKIEYEKTISRKEMTETVIEKWRKPKGYSLSTTHIYLSSLKIGLNLAFGPYKEFKRMIRDKFDKEIDHEDCTAICVAFKHEGLQWNFVLIQSNEWTAEDYATICHELHHLAHFSLDEKGVKYSMDGEETFAYVQGFFMEMVVRAFIELKKSTKKK